MIFKVKEKDMWAEEWTEVEALDAEEAAEKWVKEWDEGAEYSIVGGESAHVIVEAPNGELSTWLVMGEAIPTYFAYEEDE